MKLLIRQGRLVDPVGGIGGIMDILLEDGKVAVIGSDIRESDAEVIDARGLTVCAGLVDMHVHLRDPGFEYKETVETGAAAAARGGFTSIACMPNTKPTTDTPEVIDLVKQKAAQACGVHVWPIGAVSRGQKGQELTDFEALKAAGAVALSDDGVPVQSANLMRDGLILAHRQNLTMARVNPPLRTKADVEAIIEGLKDGTIDAIATDHAPHSAEEKARTLTEAPSGMVGLETALGVTLTYLYHTKEMPLSDILRKMTINPACILRLPSKGRLSIGADGDMVIFDPEEEWTVDPAQFASKGRNTPFGGRKLKGKVKYTIVGGKVIYQDKP